MTIKKIYRLKGYQLFRDKDLVQSIEWIDIEDHPIKINRQRDVQCPISTFI